MSRIDPILARLGALYPKSIDLSLDRVRGLMHRLGDPQDRLPPVIHVAGTNGKGSTVAMLRAILEAAGYRAHVYTSPHLVSYTERFRVAGRLIAETDLVDILAEIERINAGEPITVFEATTAAAFLAFARVPADIILLETGLGGRLDATNLIAAPAVTAITPVSMDHMSFLGDRLELIATEKAGILKVSRPAAIGPQEPAAAQVITNRAAALGSPLSRNGQEWQATSLGDSWRFAGRHWNLELPLPNLQGVHQIDNAGLALATLEFLDGFPRLDAAAIAAGLTRIEWPARLQRLTSGPLVDAVPSRWELWLDGGHNPSAAQALATHAQGWRDRPLHLIVGMLANRDPVEFVAPLTGLAASIQTVTIPGEANSHSAEAMAELLGHAEISARPANSIVDALRKSAAADEAPTRVLICGSLYLAGSVLAENQ